MLDFKFASNCLQDILDLWYLHSTCSYVISTHLCVLRIFHAILGKGQAKITPNHETYILWATNDEERQKWIKDMRKVMYSSFGGGKFNTCTFDL